MSFLNYFDVVGHIFCTICYQGVSIQAGSYVCLALECLGMSLYDVVHANRHKGLHMITIQCIAKQLLEQLAAIHALGYIHTDIKHRNCCLALSAASSIDDFYDGEPVSIKPEQYAGKSIKHDWKYFGTPAVKLIDYGNVTADSSSTKHFPIHTQPFRAPEIHLQESKKKKPNFKAQWSYSSDIWSLAITLAYLYRGTFPIRGGHTTKKLLTSIRIWCGQELDRTDVEKRHTADEFFDAQTSGLKQFADLIKKMTIFEPEERISASDALKHSFFREKFSAPN